MLRGLLALAFAAQAESFTSVPIEVPGLSDKLSPGAVVYTEASNSEAIGNLLLQRFFESPEEPRIPVIVVIAAIVADVQVTVKYAYDETLDFGVVGGGHGNGGLGHTDGLLLDMSMLKEVSVDTAAGLTTFQAGNTIGSVDAASKEAGVFIPNGNCPPVGVGAVLHGGYGVMNKRAGLGIDNIVSYQLVTADGELHEVDAENTPDLFWALRGAAPAFGVVVSMTMKHFPVEDHFGGGLSFDDVAALPRIIDFVNTNALHSIDNFHMRLDVFNVPPPATVTIELALWGDGSDFSPWGGKQAVVDALITAAGVPPTLNIIAPDNYLAYPTYLAQVIESAPRGFNIYALTAGTTSAELPVALAEEVATAYTTGMPQGTYFFLHLYGGVFNSVEPTATPFAGRDMRWDWIIQASWPPGGAVPPEGVAGIKGALTALSDAVKSQVPAGEASEHIYINWGPSTPENIRAAYGANLPRLLDLKKQIDPTNFFHRNYDLGSVM